MKKVGILTFHAAYNYGAVLQAYALKEKIQKLGFETYIINFRSDGQKQQYSIINFKKMDIATISRNIQNLFYFNKIKKRNNKFEKFIEQDLNIYPQFGIDENQVKELSKKFDYIVVGSDQIWNNSEKMQDKNDIFFLNFDGNFKRISYAASFGDDATQLLKDKEKFIPWLKKFDNISVRENEGKELLDSISLDSVITLDPTLLLEKKDWENVMKRINLKKKYILYYSVNSRKYSINITKKISKKLNMPVINLVLHPKSMLSGFRYIIDCAPDEFLAYIKNAEFICTNSFHGTVFSIIFEKPFIAIFDEKDGKIVKENRKYTLLNNLKLDDHIVTESSSIDIDKFMNYDYSKSKEQLAIIRNKSNEFLEKALKGEKND